MHFEIKNKQKNTWTLYHHPNCPYFWCFWNSCHSTDALQANLLIQTVSRKANRFWIREKKKWAQRQLHNSLIFIILWKNQSQNYSANSVATVWEIQECVLSPVNWKPDLTFLKGRCNTDINLRYLMLGLMQPSKMHFVTLPSTGYRKSTVF